MQLFTVEFFITNGGKLYTGFVVLLHLQDKVDIVLLMLRLDLPLHTAIVSTKPVALNHGPAAKDCC